MKNSALVRVQHLVSLARRVTSVKRGGFTIVELLIVIVIISVLAAVTIFALNGMQKRAQTSSAAAELKQTANKIELYNASTGNYPATINDVGISSNNFTYQYTNSGTSYCITATQGTTNYYLSNSQPGIITGACPGHAAGAWTPAHLPDINLWLKADAITGLANGDGVATWPDSSSKGNNAIQTAPSNQPTYVASAINGLPAVNFNPSSAQRFGSAASTSNAEQTILVVAMVDSLAANRSIRGSYPMIGGLQFRFTSTGKQQLLKQNVSGLGESTAAVALNTWCLSSATYSDSSDQVTYRLNRTPNGSFATTYTLTAGATTNIGAHPNAVEYFSGRIAELIAYSSLLSNAQIIEVENYLAAKYGL